MPSRCSESSLLLPLARSKRQPPSLAFPRLRWRRIGQGGGERRPYDRALWMRIQCGFASIVNTCTRNTRSVHQQHPSTGTAAATRCSPRWVSIAATRIRSQQMVWSSTRRQIWARPWKVLMCATSPGFRRSGSIRSRCRRTQHSTRHKHATQAHNTGMQHRHATQHTTQARSCCARAPTCKRMCVRVMCVRVSLTSVRTHTTPHVRHINVAHVVHSAPWMRTTSLCVGSAFSQSGSDRAGVLVWPGIRGREGHL